MKKLLSGLGFGLALLLNSSLSYAVAEMRALPAGFCLQNFNAYGPIYAKDVTERTEILGRELQTRSACDVVHLQEVWNKSQISQLERDLSAKYLLSSPNKESRIGLMSLFQFERGEETTVLFKVNNLDGAMDRLREIFNVRKAFHVVKADPRLLNEQIYFLNTHLHPTSSAVRVTQILDILEWRLQHQDLKLVASGDFNAGPDSLERMLMMAVLGTHDGLYEYVGGYPEGLCTYCAGNPRGWLLKDQIFDYVFFSNVGEAHSALQVKSAQINLRGTPRAPLSDHYGLRIDFEIQSQSPGDRDQLNLRREQAAMALTEALDILIQENDRKFTAAEAQIKALLEQLQVGQGPFAEYFEKFH